MSSRTGLIAVALAAAGAAVALAGDVEEKFSSGALKVKYATGEDGKKNGALVEYYENGKTKLKATYRNGELSGPYVEYFENGKVRINASYLKGRLHGDYVERDEKGRNKLTAVYKDGKLAGAKTEFENGKAGSSQGYRDGELIYPKSADAIRKALAEIYGGAVTSKKGAAGVPEMKAALMRLRAYRYLCDIPYKDVELDEDLNRLAAAAADICSRIGKLDHAPKNPGMPEAEYKFAYKGAQSSNLYMGLTVLDRCVDGWMNDSDPSNIDRVGHRRWCLNPAMLKVGFGEAGRCAAQAAHDRSRREPFEFDILPYPARGYFPASYFSPRHAWSVSLNPQKYRVPANGVKVKLYVVDANYKKAAEPMELDYFNIDRGGFGVPLCIIFRPARIDLNPGKRYRVEIEGVEGPDGKPLSWLVEFMEG